MTDLLAYEPAIRLGCFAAVLLAMMGWEWRRPRRALHLPRSRRWIANLGIVVVDSAALRLAFPVLAVGVALLAETEGWGLFHWLSAPFWAAFIVSLLLLDLTIYAQHVVFHKVPILWRLHRMHHTDLDFDVTTALRFHPLEIVLSMLVKLAVVGLLGAPAVAVLVFEVLLNATAMFNHGNVGLPPRLDRALRRLVVTPGHARHAPGPPFDPARGNRQQFRLQPIVVGSAVRHLSRPAPRRARRHDHRFGILPRLAGDEIGRAADATVSDAAPNSR